MDDYISRGAVLAKAYWHGDSCTQSNPHPDGVEAVDVSAIEQIPAADVVEVVRCKECRFRDKTDFCGHWEESISNDDFFCASGMRRWRNG